MEKRTLFIGKKHTKETKEKLSFANKGKIPPNCIKIYIDNILYDSYADASRVLNIPVPTVLFRLNSLNYKYKNYYKEGFPKNIKDLVIYKSQYVYIIDGKEYLNLAEASKTLGIEKTTITSRCESPSFSNYNYKCPTTIESIKLQELEEASRVRSSERKRIGPFLF